MAAGVYVIRNSCNHRVYVGSAQDVSKRWYKHQKDLRARTHHSRPLQAAWDELGEAEFSFELVLTVTNVADLLFYEQCTMDRLHAGPAQGGFNSSNKARAARGYKHSRKRRVAAVSTQEQADADDYDACLPLQRVGIYIFDKDDKLFLKMDDVEKAALLVRHLNHYYYSVLASRQSQVSIAPDDIPGTLP